MKIIFKPIIRVNFYFSCVAMRITIVIARETVNPTEVIIINLKSLDFRLFKDGPTVPLN